jgi:hypothetical protein
LSFLSFTRQEICISNQCPRLNVLLLSNCLFALLL